MHAYFIDDWTGQKKYQKEVDGLDLLLTQKGVTGRKIKLNRLHDLDASVRDMAENGIRTFVAVGNDATASRLLNSLLKLDWFTANNRHKATLAVLPIGKNQLIAANFGCNNLIEAVEALRHHRTMTIDLGKLNKRHYFITAATFREKVSLGFLSYTISSLRREHRVSICNTNIFSGRQPMENNWSFNPQDGILEAVIAYPGHPRSFWSKLFSHSELNNDYIIESVFPHKKIMVHSKEKIVNVYADMAKQLSAPVEVEIEPAKIDVIISAKRKSQ
ncbi:MAG: diacylglycerol kinase family protein [Candidatus Komeilibacteria bacterium]|nr:diacylglycerol kinase family protein [Candidatus Komeilibacteria bacterium]